MITGIQSQCKWNELRDMIYLLGPDTYKNKS